MDLSSSPELLIALLSAVGATAAAAALTRYLFPWVAELTDQPSRREKDLERLKDRIRVKVENGVTLSAPEIANIGRGLYLPSALAIRSVYQLYAEAEDEETHEIYKALIEEFNRTEPFESLPEEARPSLARLSILCRESTQSSDRELLHPLTKLLSEYQEMKREHGTIRRQGRISYVVALISFFIGVVGVVLAFTGPSKTFIQEELQKSRQEIIEEVGAAGDVGPTDERYSIENESD